MASGESEFVDVCSLHVATVLPAGGVGERTGLSVPKQYIDVLGRPLICYTIDAFDRVPWISDIVVPVGEDSRNHVDAMVAENDWRCVSCCTGGATRHRSIANGVEALSKGSKQPDVVIIHDAVRPLVDGSTLQQVVKAAHQYGAAGVVRPLVSTVVKPDSEMFLESTLTRSLYQASEMPQAFRFSVIHKAYQMCSEEELDHGTECLELARKYSQAKVRLIEGPDNLWKVTYKKDMYAFEGILKESKSVVLVSEHDEDQNVMWLTSHLKKLNVQVQMSTCRSIGSLSPKNLNYCTVVIKAYRISAEEFTPINGLKEDIQSFCQLLQQKLIGRNIGLVILLLCDNSSTLLPRIESSIRRLLKTQRCPGFNINCLLSQYDQQEDQMSVLTALIRNHGDSSLDGQLLVA